MVQAGVGGLDTPRTNVGDATYLSRQPDFDISQELSFQSPTKDANVLHQMRNGGRPSLKTPRGSSRAPFADRRNLPAGLGGAEFTPLLKSATRNSTRRQGKENGLATPGFLAKIDEDMTPMPVGESSVYGASRNTSSFMESTPLPVNEDTTSTTSTPLVMRRRGDGKGILEDGNQLSLREQENVIDKIEKENFGLKLKIHFLEEALRKAGPGFSEAALKENTELKVDKVTMHRELQRYKKHLTSAEKDLESYRQQILELGEKAKRKFADENQRAELNNLRKLLEEKDADIVDLQDQLADEQDDHDQMEKLKEQVGDLEADIREKDRIITEHEDELEDVKEKYANAEEDLKDMRRRMAGLEEEAKASEDLQEAKDTIQDLEADVRRLEQKLDDMKDKLEDAVSEKERAETDLEELQEEMANKSVMTKGLSRQVEEKIARLQTDLEKARKECSSLEEKHGSQQKEIDNARSKLKEACRERDSSEETRQVLEVRLAEAQTEMHSLADEKKLLQTRHDALTNESSALQREVASLRKSVTDLEESLEHEKYHSLSIERDIRAQYKDEIDRLNDGISDLQAECREKDNLYDNDSEKWETERQKLESERDHAEERAAGLQRTIDKLRDAEGALTSKETRLQEALQSETDRHKSEQSVLNRQIEDLQQNLDSRQAMLEDLRNELSAVRDLLRQSQLDNQAQAEKVEALEDEVEVLQATIDEESEKARLQEERMRRECDSLRQQLASLQEAADSTRTSKNASQESAHQSNENIARLKFQLADANENLANATKERRALQDRHTTLDVELRTLCTSLAETKAERDELEEELRHERQQAGDTFRFDQERLDLRTAKTKLDAEVRRLREENAALADERQEVEQLLEAEADKAAAEEERLNQEILQLHAKLRQSSDAQELPNARRAIRELERRIEAYETQQATTQLLNLGDGNSELSLLQHDLSAARKKEIELLQQESSQKETIRSLKRQIADLERKAHEAALERLATSPPSHGGSAQKAEISELRHQLSTAHQSIHDLKKALRDAEKKADAGARELQARLDEIEEQKLHLEQDLDDAQVAAEEAATAHEQALKKYKQKAERYKRERDELATAARENQQGNSNHSGLSEMSVEERRDLHKMLRESQTAADRLELQVQEQREALEELMTIEMQLRKKLDRARSERAAYRASAERLQKDVKALKSEKDKAEAEASAAVAAAEEERALLLAQKDLVKTRLSNGVDTDAIIRAAEAAERRHEKEIRGMVMQMEWLKACWDREAKLRHDAAFAKRYLLLEVQIRDACNKADLAIINRIRAQLNPSGRSALGQLSPVVRSQHQRAISGNNNSSSSAQHNKQDQPQQPPRTKLQRVLRAVRFVVRMQIGASNWAKHEKVRQRLADCVEEMEKEERIKKMRDQWRADHHHHHHGHGHGHGQIRQNKIKKKSSSSAGGVLVVRRRNPNQHHHDFGADDDEGFDETTT